MTTPNNQPTPPEGMRIIPVEYLRAGHPLPQDAVWITIGNSDDEWESCSNYDPSRVVNTPYGTQLFAFATAEDLPCFAIPITPTVPATGEASLAESCLGPQRPMTEEEQEMIHDFQLGDTTPNEKGGEQRQELLPCPFCGASDWKQDDDISDWRVLTHKPECFLAEDKLGRTRQEIISLPNKEAQQWNTRK